MLNNSLMLLSIFKTDNVAQSGDVRDAVKLCERKFGGGVIATQCLSLGMGADLAPRCAFTDADVSLME